VRSIVRRQLGTAIAVCLVAVGCQEGSPAAPWEVGSERDVPGIADSGDIPETRDDGSSDADTGGDTEPAGDADTVDGFGAVNLPGESPASRLFLDGTTSCAVRRDNRFRCWGSFELGDPKDYHPNPPAGERFRAVIPEDTYNLFCALRVDDSIVCWNDSSLEMEIPKGRFQEIESGTRLYCGLRPGGTVECWGLGSEPGRDPEEGRFEQAIPPDGTYDSLAVGSRAACALRSSGDVECWGANRFGQTEPPEGPFDQLAVGTTHGCGLRPDDTVDCWGNDERGLTSPPEGRFTEISAGTFHSCGLRHDGEIECWGEAVSNLDDPPDGRFVEIDSGSMHACAIERDTQQVHCWGSNNFLQAMPPTQRPDGL